MSSESKHGGGDPSRSTFGETATYDSVPGEVSGVVRELSSSEPSNERLSSDAAKLAGFIIRDQGLFNSVRELSSNPKRLEDLIALILDAKAKMEEEK